MLYPTPEVRVVKKIVSGSVATEVTVLHHDGLGSVRAVTAGTGMRTETSSYRPYGEQSEGVYALNVAEAKGYIGERFDADAGLQYLNARYYDPRLGMFLQPDWWEVYWPGVGTNRYSYAFGDPINGKDPSGHNVTSSPVPKERPNNLMDKYEKDNKGKGFLGIDWGLNGEWNRIGGVSSGMSWKDFKALAALGGYDAGGKPVDARLALTNIAMKLTNIQLVMGELQFLPPGQGLVAFLNQNGFPDLRVVGFSAIAWENISIKHSWYSMSPIKKSRFFYNYGAEAVKQLVDNMVSGVGVSAYRIAYNRIAEVGVSVKFTQNVGLTGTFGGRLPYATDTARFDIVVDGQSGSIVNGYPTPPW